MDQHPASLPLDVLLGQCTMRRLRRSGPGGQHRNKVETAVQFIHGPSGISAEANERRSQAENRSVAALRLRVNLALAIRCEVDEASEPSPLWRSRLRGTRIEVSASHDDFPALLAEALDRLAACEADPRHAASRLGTSSSQLVRFIASEPRALALLNQWRAERNLGPLRAG
ncbi:MAG: peptide chain release factor-like protein [Patescibacteria group bacterium]|nr:peptide chain release factor-like protein [Patescibacteria group bacterium]